MLKEWEKEYSQLNKMKHAYKSNSGIKIKPLYTPSDTNEVEYDNDLGFPGKPPFVRGVYPTMYHGRPWTMRQLAGSGPPGLISQLHNRPVTIQPSRFRPCFLTAL